jgi:hypothetical protein
MKNTYMYILGSDGIKGLVKKAIYKSDDRHGQGGAPGDTIGVLPSQFCPVKINPITYVRLQWTDYMKRQAL